MTQNNLDALSRLAILHGTDKFGYHDYTPNYHALLNHLRDRPIRLLEIGVGGYGDEDRGGQSLAVWRDYFPNAEIIVGIDIQKKTMDLGPRVRILQGSQVDADFLAELDAELGPFDVIIDDGSHRNEHVVETFGILFPRLVDGGIYIVEDVQTSFHPRFGGSLELTAPNSVGLLSGMMLDWPAAADHPVGRIDRFHNIFALQKLSADQVAAQATPSLADSDLLDASLAQPECAVAVIGDVSIPDALSGRLENAAISGFDSPDSLRDAVTSEGFGLVIAAMNEGTSDQALSQMIDAVQPQDGCVVLLGDSADRRSGVLADLLAQIDHKEMEVHFPDAAILPAASKTYSAHAFADGVLLQAGENTYPSNFRWTPDHPRTGAAIIAMGDVLEDEAASETGLLQYADILYRHRSPEDSVPVLERLEAMGSRERRFFQMMGQHRQKIGDMEGALATYSLAFETFENDPQFAANVASCHLRNGDEAKAEELLRAVVDDNKRARAPMVMLSRILERRGELEEALTLSEQSINLFPVQHRLPRLIDLVRLAQRAGSNKRAQAALNRALTLAPEDETLLKIQQELID